MHNYAFKWRDGGLLEQNVKGITIEVAMRKLWTKCGGEKYPLSTDYRQSKKHLKAHSLLISLLL